MMRVVLALVFLVTQQAIAQGVQGEVEEVIRRQFAQLRSLEAHVVRDGQTPAGIKIRREGRVNLLVDEEGQWRYWSDVIARFAERPLLNGRSVGVRDGRFTHVEVPGQEGQVMIVEVGDHPQYLLLPLGGERLLSLLRANGDVRVEGEVFVDGDYAYVLTVRIAPEKAQAAKLDASVLRVHVSKQWGVEVKRELFDAQGALLTQTVYTNMRVNLPLSETRFVYRLPKEFRLQTMGSLLSADRLLLSQY